MTCVRTPDPLDQVEPGPYADDAADGDASIVERLRSWAVDVLGGDSDARS